MSPTFPRSLLVSSLPSYIVPTTRRIRGTERLRQLAQRLSSDGIDDDAPEAASKVLIAALDKELEQKTSDAQFAEEIQRADSVSIEAVTWTFGESKTLASDSSTVTLDPMDLDKIFVAVGRRPGDVFKPWWRHRVEDAHIDPDQARREVIALGEDSGVQSRLEKVAEEKVYLLFSRYQNELKSQSDAAKQVYERIRDNGASPALSPLEFPESIDIKRDDKATALRKNLYVDAQGLFPRKLNKWERRVIEEELRRDDVVGWLHNEPRKRDRSLCTKYRLGGSVKPMYPDFILLRQAENGSIVADILDPHTTSLGDAPAKAVGLAEYARDHGSQIRADRVDHRGRNTGSDNPA